MVTREIPRTEWQEFFDGFSRRHDQWLLTVEVLRPDIGAQIEARDLPLDGITADPDRNDAIAIMLHDREGRDLTHTVSWTRHVRLLQTGEGADQAVEIESDDGSTAILRFRSTVPAELVDGT
jgi:hypothetical protein